MCKSCVYDLRVVSGGGCGGGGGGGGYVLKGMRRG